MRVRDDASKRGTMTNMLRTVKELSTSRVEMMVAAMISSMCPHPTDGTVDGSLSVQALERKGCREMDSPRDETRGRKTGHAEGYLKTTDL